MGQESTGSSRAPVPRQMTGKDSPRVILSLPGDNVPNKRADATPKVTGNTQLKKNQPG